MDARRIAEFTMALAVIAGVVAYTAFTSTSVVSGLAAVALLVGVLLVRIWRRREQEQVSG